jgi:hypothetical protein
MAMRPNRVRWAWLPMALAFAALTWVRLGPLIAIGLVGGGLALGLLGNAMVRRGHRW